MECEISNTIDQLVLKPADEKESENVTIENSKLRDHLEEVNAKMLLLDEELRDFFETSEKDGVEDGDLQITEFMGLKIACLSSMVSDLLEFTLLQVCGGEDFSLAETPIRFDLVKFKMLMEHILKMEQRLKSKIQRILKNSEDSTKSSNKPNLAGLLPWGADDKKVEIANARENLSSEEEVEDADDKKMREWLESDEGETKIPSKQNNQQKKKNTGIYKPPKNVAIEMPTEKRTGEKQKKKEDKIVERLRKTEEYAELKAELSNAPQQSRAISLVEERRIRKLKEVTDSHRDFEEDNFRAPVLSKTQKRQLKDLTRSQKVKSGYSELMNVPMPSMDLGSSLSTEGPRKNKKMKKRKN